MSEVLAIENILYCCGGLGGWVSLVALLD